LLGINVNEAEDKNFDKGLPPPGARPGLQVVSPSSIGRHREEPGEYASPLL